MILCRALSYEENTLDKSRLKRGFWKPMPNRMDFLICAGTPTTVIPVQTFKDPDFKPCLQTLKPGKSGQLSSRIIVR